MIPKIHPLATRKRAGKIPKAIPETIEIKTFMLLFRKMKRSVCQSFKDFTKSIKGIMSATILSGIEGSFVDAEYPAKTKKMNMYPAKKTYFLILEKKSFIIIKDKS